jgi:hypothetical protein
MRTPGSDAYAEDAGVSIYFEGEAARDGKTWHFAWPFRKSISYYRCGAPNDGGDFVGDLALASGESASVNIEVQAEALFRPGLDPAPLHFEPYARADANGDGEITLEELATVPLDDVKADGLYTKDEDSFEEVLAGEVPPDATGVGCLDDHNSIVSIETLSDFVYCKLVSRLARFQSTGSCLVLVGRGLRERG